MPTFSQYERSFSQYERQDDQYHPVYQSTETQSSIICTSTFSINIQKVKHVHNLLITSIGFIQRFSPLNISGLTPLPIIETTLFPIFPQGNSYSSKAKPETSSTDQISSIKASTSSRFPWFKI